MTSRILFPPSDNRERAPPDQRFGGGVGLRPGAVAIADCFLFRDLGGDDRRRVLAHGRHLAVPKGEVLVHQGGRCEAFTIVTSGEFSFRKSSPDGLLFVLGRIRPGEFFGEGLLALERQSEVEVVATAPATVFCFRAAEFRSLLGRHPSIARRMIDELTERINRFANLSFELATTKLDTRLRRTIERLAGEMGQLHDGGIIRPAPTHAELATMLGTTREVISRSMTLLCRDGSIKTGRQQIEIRSVRRLKSDNAVFAGTPSSPGAGRGAIN